MIHFTTDKEGVRFTLSTQELGADDPRKPPTVFNARRINDDRHLPGQFLFREPEYSATQKDFNDLVELWFWGHGDHAAAPAPTFCYGCGAELTADHDTNYQFDNALWIKFDGGYGMFIDDMVDTLDIASEVLGDPDAVPLPIGGPGWTEEQTAEYRRLADNVSRVVICHECAHQLCDTVPWVEKLLNSHSSHAHKTSYIEANPDHSGWDLDRRQE